MLTVLIVCGISEYYCKLVVVFSRSSPHALSSSLRFLDLLFSLPLLYLSLALALYRSLLHFTGSLRLIHSLTLSLWLTLILSRVLYLNCNFPLPTRIYYRCSCFRAGMPYTRLAAQGRLLKPCPVRSQNESQVVTE